MKITITLECEMDGPRPSDAALTESVQQLVPGVIGSEQVDGTGTWALIINTSTVEISD